MLCRKSNKIEISQDDDLKTSESGSVESNSNFGSSSNVSEEKLQLKRHLGLPESVGIIAGIIVGSGIFASPTGVLRGVNGSVGMSLVLWAACGIFSCLAALCYCELAAMFRESGGEYNFLYRGYKKFGIGATLAFMFTCTALFVSKTTSSAAKALVFSAYAIEPFYSGDCKPPDLIIKFAAAVAIIVFGCVNYFSVRGASKVVSIFTIGKFIGMGIIIVGGFVRIALGDKIGLNNFNNAFQSEDLTGLGFTQIGLAFYQGLWAYDGWPNLTSITEEVKDPKRTVPRATIISLLLVIVFYLLVNIGYFSVLTPEEILSSEAVAVTWGYRVLGSWGWVMSVVVCFSTLGSLTGTFLSASRIPFAAGRRGHFPQILGMITIDHLSPGPAVILLVVVTLIYLIPSDFGMLVNAFNFTSWFFKGLVILSVIILRFTHKDYPRPYKVPIPIPIVSFSFALYLLIAPLVESPDVLILYAAAFVFCTPIIYFVFVYKQFKVPGTDYVTTFLQNLLNVAPTNWKEKK